MFIGISIGPYNLNCHVAGKEILRIGSRQPKAENIQCFFLSRDGYERLLRQLVLKSSGRIKWLTGTVTGLNVGSKDVSTISSVEIRGSDNNRNDVPTSLVVGWYQVYFGFTGAYTLADCSGTTQIGFKLLRRIASERISTCPTDDTLPWNRTKVTYDSGIRYKMFRFHVPPEARDSLPIPGGYSNCTFIYTTLPIPGKTNLIMSMNRIEGHRSEYPI